MNTFLIILSVVVIGIGIILFVRKKSKPSDSGSGGSGGSGGSDSHDDNNDHYEDENEN